MFPPIRPSRFSPLIGALAALAAPLLAPAAEPPRPNIIYILADDLGYGDIGPFGQKKVPTPELDRLARDGMRLTAHYCGAPVCAPSRYTFIRGVHIGHAPQIGQQQELRDGDQTVSSVLKSAGYRTGVVGKWGLGQTTGHPNAQGFDHWFGFLDQVKAHNHYPDHLVRNRERVSFADNPNTRSHHTQDLFTNEARAFIRASHDARQPFFLYLAYTLPHAELIVPPELEAPFVGKLGDPERPPVDKPYKLGSYNEPRHPRAARAGMISMLDRDVGRLRALLEELRVADNTLLVFTSDNGPAIAGGNRQDDIRFFNSTGGFRDIKRSVYEGGIRMPTVVWWPARIPAGTDSPVPSIAYDWLPTFAELAGARLAAPTDGLSLVPVLTARGATVPREYLFWEYAERGVASDVAALRKGDWKLVLNRKKSPDAPELYNLAEDPFEKSNRAAAEPDRTRELLEKMKPLLR